MTLQFVGAVVVALACFAASLAAGASIESVGAVTEVEGEVDVG